MAKKISCWAGKSSIAKFFLSTVCHFLSFWVECSCKKAKIVMVCHKSHHPFETLREGLKWKFHEGCTLEEMKIYTHHFIKICIFTRLRLEGRQEKRERSYSRMGKIFDFHTPPLRLGKCQECVQLLMSYWFFNFIQRMGINNMEKIVSPLVKKGLKSVLLFGVLSRLKKVQSLIVRYVF